MIRRIRQKHEFGCGVASIAMLANISYDRALVITHPFRKPRQHTTTTLERSLLVLTFLGLSPKLVKKPQRISSIKNPALLVVDCGTKREPFFHAVVWDPDSKRIMDPYAKRAWPTRKYQRGLKCIIEIQTKTPT